MIVPAEEVFADVQADVIYEQLRGVLGTYGRWVSEHRQPDVARSHVAYATSGFGLSQPTVQL